MSQSVCIVGTGYVGLTTAVVLAEKGHQVHCVDRRPDWIARLQKGESPFFEPGLQEALSAVSLRFTTDLEAAVKESTVVFLCVGTPSLPNSGAADFSALLGALEEVAMAWGRLPKAALKDRVLVIKSTVPPGTTEELLIPRVEKHLGSGAVSVAMVPEFLREGAALADSRLPGRVVIGCHHQPARVVLKSLFADFSAQVFETTPRGAEMSKVLTNALLATLISFSNEAARAAGALGGAELETAFRALAADPRFSADGTSRLGLLSYLWPGPGFGGSCFPKDVRALFQAAQETGVHLSLLETVLHVNQTQAAWMVEMVERWSETSIAGRRVAVFGLSFKPDTDDVRETPARPLIQVLLEKGSTVTAADPIASANFRSTFPSMKDFPIADKMETLLEGAELLFVVTPWKEIRAILTNPDLLKHMRRKWIVDCRGYFSETDRKTLTDYGCRIFSPLAWNRL